MKRQIYTMAIFVAMILSTQSVMAQVYEVPPSSSVSHSVPVISDEAMEVCVILYNDAKNLKSKMNTIHVDRYSKSSVSAYNSKVNRHTQMTNQFNSDCAGKQSRSAYEAAQRLNNKTDK